MLVCAADAERRYGLRTRRCAVAPSGDGHGFSRPGLPRSLHRCTPRVAPGRNTLQQCNMLQPGFLVVHRCTGRVATRRNTRQQCNMLQHGALFHVCALLQAADADRRLATVRCPTAIAHAARRTSRAELQRATPGCDAADRAAPCCIALQQSSPCCNIK